MAALNGTSLPDGIFFDSEGENTTNPIAAKAVKAFGDAKGYALCVAIEILCGALMGAKMGSQVRDEYDLGFMFMAINPLWFRESLVEFCDETSGLATELRQAPTTSALESVRLPGDRAEHSRELAQIVGSVQLDEHTWQRLLDMSRNPSANVQSGL